MPILASSHWLLEVFFFFSKEIFTHPTVSDTGTLESITSLEKKKTLHTAHAASPPIDHTLILAKMLLLLFFFLFLDT